MIVVDIYRLDHENPDLDKELWKWLVTSTVGDFDLHPTAIQNKETGQWFERYIFENQNDAMQFKLKFG